MVLLAPIRSEPLSLLNSRSISPACSSSARALGYKRRPCSLITSRFPTRSNNCTPSCPSTSASAALTADCDSDSTIDAWVVDPLFSTSAKTSSCRNVMCIIICPSHAPGRPCFVLPSVDHNRTLPDRAIPFICVKYSPTVRPPTLHPPPHSIPLLPIGYKVIINFIFL